jgi:hypothetical protein
MRYYSPTSIQSRLTSLRNRHFMTSRKIDTESKKPNPDGFLLQELKRRRLKLKDEITGYSLI